MVRLRWCVNCNACILYGLKQSPLVWFRRLNVTKKKYGFQQRNTNHTLFIKHRQDKITTQIVYVDDMIIVGDDPDEIAKL